MVTQTSYDTLLQNFESLQKDKEKLELTCDNLQLQILELKRLIFGSKSERFKSEQTVGSVPTLFEVAPLAEEVVVSTQQVSYERTKKETRINHPGRNAFPEQLRRQEIILDPQGIDLTKSVRVGEDVTEVLAYIPSELYVKRTIRPRYHIPAEQRMVQAAAPDRIFSRSSVDESLVANVIVEKYVDHLPLYRQAKRYERQGVVISESTLGDIISSCSKVLEPLYEAHYKEVLSCGYLNVDETTIRVQTSEKKGATHQGYYWVLYDNLNRTVLFNYDPSRKKETPQRLLKGYRGYLQCDGFSGYDNFDDVDGITLVGCLAHARRKFHEASNSDKTRANEALKRFQAVYDIERQIKITQISGEEKKQSRIAHALPLLKELKSWMEKTYPQVLPSSAMGKAINYSLKRWDKLCLYAETAILDPDNNKVENSIRPVAIGRKNYLFAGSHEAAQRGAMMYSLLGTCKAHGIEPYAWLKDILIKLPAHPINKIKELLPQYYNK